MNTMIYNVNTENREQRPHRIILAQALSRKCAYVMVIQYPENKNQITAAQRRKRIVFI